MLYRIIRLPSKERVQYVGCYVLRWGQVDVPTVAFVEADRAIEALNAASEALRQLLPLTVASPDVGAREKAYAALAEINAALGEEDADADD